VIRPIASADVVVVGCGVIGLAGAERLAAGGLTVALVDELGVAGGASGASGGLVRAFDPGADDPSWAARGLERYLERGWRGRWPQVREDGSLVLLAEREAGLAADAVVMLRERGHAADVLTARQVRDRFPDLSVPPDLIAVHEERGGWLPAQEVVVAMLRDADPGVTHLSLERATGISVSGSRVSGVHTAAGPIGARAVVLAAGVGSAVLARSVGVELDLVNRSVGYCVFRPAGPVRGTLPVVVDATTGAWTRRWDDDGAVLAGVVSARRGVPSEVRTAVPSEEERRVREVARRRDPRLADAPLIGGVTAYDAAAPRGRGEVVAWPEPHGLVTATGWNGSGFKLAPAIGERIAELVREVVS
jgi:glycine/D-amino acid oxidase-like deaminating enzyme